MTHKPYDAMNVGLRDPLICVKSIINLLCLIIYLPRRDYVSLLNANTLSLDAIASLNGALREIQKTETYENQEHVQWLTGEMVSLFDAVVPL